MGGSTDKAADQRLLEATLAYVAGHADRRFDAFREAIADWGEDWTGVAPVHLPASDLLADALPFAGPGTAERELMGLYVKERASRFWEQSYTAADEAVGADLLAGYGYCEIVGKRGPFLSGRVRAGVGVFAANVDYPRIAIGPKRSTWSLRAPGRSAWAGVRPRDEQRAPSSTSHRSSCTGSRWTRNRW